jgi:nucleoside-diphosphate-sugar epimerase
MAGAPRRILLTGASGFVGRHLTAALTAAWPDTELLTPPVDVCDAAVLDDIVRAASPEACIHLAAVSTIAMARQDEDRAWQVNLHGTLNLAHAILRHAPHCQLVFASSADIYGASFRAGVPLTEAAAPMPLNLYAATKAAADVALGALAEQGLRVVRLRPFNHTGPGQTVQFVVPAFACQAARIAAGMQEPEVSVGNLEPRRDFLDVRDVCAAYVACVARREALAPGLIINLASGTVRRIGDILSDLLSLAGVTARVVVDPARTRSTDVTLSTCDTAQAQAVLGWAPAIPWRRTLQDVLDDWRARMALNRTEPDR